MYVFDYTLKFWLTVWLVPVIVVIMYLSQATYMNNGVFTCLRQTNSCTIKNTNMFGNTLITEVPLNDIVSASSDVNIDVHKRLKHNGIATSTTTTSSTTYTLYINSKSKGSILLYSIIDPWTPEPKFAMYRNIDKINSFLSNYKQNEFQVSYKGFSLDVWYIMLCYFCSVIFLAIFLVIAASIGGYRNPLRNLVFRSGSKT